VQRTSLQRPEISTGFPLARSPNGDCTRRSNTDNIRAKIVARADDDDARIRSYAFVTNEILPLIVHVCVHENELYIYIYVIFFHAYVIGTAAGFHVFILKNSQTYIIISMRLISRRIDCLVCYIITVLFPTPRITLQSHRGLLTHVIHTRPRKLSTYICIHNNIYKLM